VDGVFGAAGGDGGGAAGDPGAVEVFAEQVLEREFVRPAFAERAYRSDPANSDQAWRRLTIWQMKAEGLWTAAILRSFCARSLREARSEF
jgi:hypothetical protein